MANHAWVIQVLDECAYNCTALYVTKTKAEAVFALSSHLRLVQHRDSSDPRTMEEIVTKDMCYSTDGMIYAIDRCPLVSKEGWTEPNETEL